MKSDKWSLYEGLTKRCLYMGGGGGANGNYLSAGSCGGAFKNQWLLIHDSKKLNSSFHFWEWKFNPICRKSFCGVNMSLKAKVLKWLLQWKHLILMTHSINNALFKMFKNLLVSSLLNLLFWLTQCFLTFKRWKNQPQKKLKYKKL